MAVRYAYIENVAFVDFRACYRCNLPTVACGTCRWNHELQAPTDRVPSTRALFLVPRQEREKAEV